MILHQHQEEFRDLIQLTSTEKKIPLVYVEKDYYVTLALKELSKSQALKPKAIFKGGTSLSKAYKLIERFSEDIDLGVLADNLKTAGGRTLLRKLEKVLTAPEVFTEMKPEEDKRVIKGSFIRSAVCNYPKLFDENFHQASNTLLIEINRFTPSIPSEEKFIRTYIADFLQSTGQTDAIAEYQLEEFGINVMSLERTFVEKVLGVVKKSYSRYPIDKLKPKIRHFYDIYFLMKDKRVQDFLSNQAKVSDLECFEFFKQAISDEYEGTIAAGFDCTWMDYTYSDAGIFKDLEQTWEQLNSEYTENFALMVYGSLPGPDEIKKSIAELGKFIKTFDDWRKDNNIIFAKS